MNKRRLTALLRAVPAFQSAGLLWLVPFLVSAQITPPPPPKDVTELLNRISTYIIDPMIFTLFTVAFVVFIWGLVQFVGNLNNEEARSTGTKHMIWGLIGMAIMVSVNGIVGIIDATVRQIGG